MILALTDIKHKAVKDKVDGTQDGDSTYIDDDVVRALYYYPLAAKFNIPTENLPADDDINILVKRYLALSVYITVAEDNFGSTMEQIVENVVVDIWKTNKTNWTTQRDDLFNELSADLIYDPDNIPETDTVNPYIAKWSRS